MINDALCDAADSLHDWQTPERSLSLAYVLDDWHGPTDAIVRCRHCDSHALLSVQDWCGSNLATRICTVALLDRSTVETFLRNVGSDYCDLARKGQEVQALFASAGPPAVVVAVTLPDLAVTSCRDNDGRRGVRKGDWRDGMPAVEDDYWFRYLGLTKG